MKLYKYCFVLLALTTVTVSGCKNEDINEEHHYDNKLYVSSAPVCDDLLIKSNVSEATRELSYRIASPAEQDIQISFDAAPAMTAAYNLIYNDNATALDSYFYNIPTKTATIKAGDISSDNIVIDFKNTNELDKSKRYVLPVTIIDASNIDVLESARTAYFIFKGAALINVVANIKQIYFPINWKSSVNNLSTVTVEALVRSEDWVAGRENALSSVFGIEGKFLVRVGDADRPRDQVQVVAPGGNFPGPNVVPGTVPPKPRRSATTATPCWWRRATSRRSSPTSSTPSRCRTIPPSSSTCSSSPTTAPTTRPTSPAMPGPSCSRAATTSWWARAMPSITA